MVARCFTVALTGIEAQIVDVQCSVVSALPSFNIVGLPDKAVSESKERVRAALSSLSIALPPKRITLNLAPADVPKAGNHYDLPIALALLAALGVVPADKTQNTIAMGELALDGSIGPIIGALPAAFAAIETQKGFLAPTSNAAEAAAIAPAVSYGADDLHSLIAHLNGTHPLPPATPLSVEATEGHRPDLQDIRGQARAKRALEIAVAGGHHLLLVGPPGSGKTMLAERAVDLMPPLSPKEALDTATIYSACGLLKDGALPRTRPFRAPHHTASSAAIIGGGRHAGPGEISLAHNGVLFMDEFPEFARPVLEALRQPLESGTVAISRASAHVEYPAKFSLIAAANPCKCGFANDPARACNRAPNCAQDYMGRISGPLLDRFDLRLDVPAVPPHELEMAPTGETSNDVRARVISARAWQAARFNDDPNRALNCDLLGQPTETAMALDSRSKDLMRQAAEKFSLSARGYSRVLRVARTIADLDHSESVQSHHIAEALSFRFEGISR